MLTQKDIEEIKTIVREEIDEKTRLLPSKEEFFDRMDKLMGELKAMREEFDIHTGKHRDINDQLDNHNQRLSRVEKKLHLPSITD